MVPQRLILLKQCIHKPALPSVVYCPLPYLFSNTASTIAVTITSPSISAIPPTVPTIDPISTALVELDPIMHTMCEDDKFIV